MINDFGFNYISAIEGLLMAMLLGLILGALLGLFRFLAFGVLERIKE